MERQRPIAATFGAALLVVALALPAHAVDGVIEINQAKASAGGVTPGDAPGLPVTISTGTFSAEPMSFRLTGPLITSTTGNVIEILSPHVTLDLNGFAITCLLSSCNGVAVLSTQANVTVKNGSVRNFTTGVQVTGAGAHVDGIHSLDNTGTGVAAGSNCLVERCIATGNGIEGISVQTGCTVRSNTANGNDSDGIVAGLGSNVSENTVRGNSGFGLNLAIGAGYHGNTITANTGGTVNSGVSTGQNNCGAVATCP